MLNRFFEEKKPKLMMAVNLLKWDKCMTIPLTTNPGSIAILCTNTKRQTRNKKTYHVFEINNISYRIPMESFLG